MFNNKIKSLEREIRRLNGVIRKKDKDIEMLQSKNKKLEETIYTQAQDIIEKDQQIEELEDKMEGLHFKNSSLNDKLNELTKSQNEACLKFSNKMQNVEIQKVEIKKTWNDILDNTNVLVAIISYLSPKDLFYLMRIQSYLYNALKSNYDIIQITWNLKAIKTFLQN
ncbi:10662_t:CDS:2 [Gigaspora margarita]|uniref:10662_t:CDS:1 n=1 Tax=Gigaspora margarita TaxID=4874 RepID=A0ABM8W6Q0_GIGMA|nr:10662_t:CDS:2 [Gigaspora margarita]